MCSCKDLHRMQLKVTHRTDELSSLCSDLQLMKEVEPVQFVFIFATKSAPRRNKGSRTCWCCTCMQQEVISFRISKILNLYSNTNKMEPEEPVEDSTDGPEPHAGVEPGFMNLMPFSLYTAEPIGFHRRNSLNQWIYGDTGRGRRKQRQLQKSLRNELARNSHKHLRSRNTIRTRERLLLTSFKKDPYRDVDGEDAGARQRNRPSTRSRWPELATKSIQKREALSR